MIKNIINSVSRFYYIGNKILIPQSKSILNNSLYRLKSVFRQSQQIVSTSFIYKKIFNFKLFSSIDSRIVPFSLGSKKLTLLKPSLALSGLYLLLQVTKKSELDPILAALKDRFIQLDQNVKEAILIYPYDKNGNKICCSNSSEHSADVLAQYPSLLEDLNRLSLKLQETREEEPGIINILHRDNINLIRSKSIQYVYLPSASPIQKKDNQGNYKIGPSNTTQESYIKVEADAVMKGAKTLVEDFSELFEKTQDIFKFVAENTFSVPKERVMIEILNRFPSLSQLFKLYVLYPLCVESSFESSEPMQSLDLLQSSVCFAPSPSTHLTSFKTSEYCKIYISNKPKE